MNNINFGELKTLNKQDLPRAISIITNAFSEDPCLKFLLDSEEYDYNKAKHIHEYTLRLGFLYGLVLTTSPKNEGIAIWMPPKYVDTSAWMFIRAGGLKLNKLVDKKAVDRLDAYGKYASSLHHKHAKRAHWYLESLSVDPLEQGKGYASRLLKPALEYFDKHKFSCYLETHNAKNVSLYEKYGFKVMEIGSLPGTDKPHWAMLREPANS